MKKFYVTALATLTVASMVTPAFAATNQTVGKDKKTAVVEQGDGYTVTTDIGPKKITKASDSVMTPASTTYFTLYFGDITNTSYYGQTYTSYGNGQFEDTSSMSVYYDHNVVDPDYLKVSGKQTAYWSGSSPSYYATNIYMQPTETATATQTVMSVSSSGSVSISGSGSSETMKWTTIAIPNAYSGTYNWAQWELKSAGRFTSLKASDSITWQFGTANTGQLNSVYVTITTPVS